NGYTETVNLSGGYITYKTVQTEQLWLTDPQKAAEQHGIFSSPQTATDSVRKSSMENTPPPATEKTAVQVNACGLQCPGPIIQLKKEMEKLSSGDLLTIQASDLGFAQDVKSWCALTGNQLLQSKIENGVITAYIRKGNATEPVIAKNTDSATFIVFSNDMDKVLASFVLANGAIATGKKVTMFFTFWGLSVLRKTQAPAVKKDIMGKMFGSMLPKGMGKLALSSMNFAGMGAKMMKGRMKDKNVDQLETMFKNARDAGARFVACQMSMDIMGVSAEELIDDVEIGGVATYMEAASKSGLNLFI
ncbi:MAG: DsrE/DsrF/DrsH-like family protein, partial [Treponema sp.]